jgi:hypothetical protein
LTAHQTSRQPNGKPDTHYEIHFSGGRLARTFSETLFEIANQLGGALSVLGEVTPGRVANSWELVSIGATQPETTSPIDHMDTPTITYKGIEISYDERSDKWLYTLRGKDRSADILVNAKKAIDKPAPKDAEPFDRLTHGGSDTVTPGGSL